MIGSGHCLSVNAENLTTIFVLSGIFCFCVYPVSSNYTVCKRFTEEPLHRLTAVPLVLSGPFCPAGISPPRGESPLSGEANFCSSCYNFSPTKIPRRGEQAAAAAVTLPFSQLKLGRKVSGDPPPPSQWEFLHGIRCSPRAGSSGTPPRFPPPAWFPPLS